MITSLTGMHKAKDVFVLVVKPELKKGDIHSVLDLDLIIDIFSKHIASI